MSKKIISIPQFPQESAVERFTLEEPVAVTITPPVPITDNSGSLTVDGTVGVNNFPATQPVSGSVTIQSPLPVTDNAGSLTVDGTVGVNNFPAQAVIPEIRAANLAVVIAGAANAIATLTLPAAGAGLFHYITYLGISRVTTAALAGGALLTVTSTNLYSLTWRTGNTMAIVAPATGTVILTDQHFARPLKSAVANTATTIVAPAAGVAVSWHIIAHYFIAA